MKCLSPRLNICYLTILSGVAFVCLSARVSFADLYINLLAVNGTTETKESKIEHYLPPEVTADDVLDTAGLSLDYDMNKMSYLVHGMVSLAPKESKTIRIRVRDVWAITDDQVNEIQDQVEASFDRQKGTEYEERAQARREGLLERLDFIVSQQSQYADNIEKRIDRFRTYKAEFEEIRQNALSVKYWRSTPPKPDEGKVLRFNIQVQNPSDKYTRTVKQRHYMPGEVKPEHLVDAQGFEMEYDVSQGLSYLIKEEELQPNEKKSYQITVKDVWNIGQPSIDDLKDRTRKAYSLLENTEYVESAKYLVENIKKHLDAIEESQAQEKPIERHISDYRINIGRFHSAEKDVEALEQLLEAVRENLERSKVKNVLQKIKSLETIGDIAEAVFGVKPSLNNTWRIIIGVVIFVGILTLAHFLIWGKRSRESKTKYIEQEKPPESV